MAWTVVIPSDCEESLALSSRSVLRRHPYMDPARIIVVTGKINPEEVKVELPPLTFVRDSAEFKFARRVNLGFEAAGDGDVVVMGDDVEVATDRAFDLLEREAPLRILAASVRGRVGPWWQRERQSWPEVPFVSFTCVYIPRQVYQMVGPLEEGFPGYGYEDTDYCLRARRRGLSAGVCGRAVIEHTLSLPSAFQTAYKEGLSEMEAAARKAFEDKWRTRGT